MKSFFHVKTVDQVLALVQEFHPLNAEDAPLAEACGRTLAESLVAREMVPEFDRSSMDGYAVRARDTFGTSEGLPGLFEVAGEVAMGTVPDLVVGPGQAARIWTGGMLPQGADAVVMLEYARGVDDHLVELCRPAAPFDHVVRRGEDVRPGQEMLPAGRRLRPQDVGLLAALGYSQVRVTRRPAAAILSTGDEVAPVDQVPGPGRVRDVNAYTLSALVEAAGGRAVRLGLIRDDREALLTHIQAGLDQADVVVLSGGSSVGVRDLTIDAFESIPGVEILVHGVAVSPGKPLIVARKGNQSLWGLPGHIVSALITGDLFLRPLLARLLGRETERRRPIPAVLSRRVPSVHGRADYVRVRLEDTSGGLVAHPLLGPSGIISTMVQADGLIVIGLNEEGRDQGARVDVFPFDG